MFALPPSACAGLPPTALAPMQDITGLDFMRLLCECGAPDYFVTEYIRVHETSRISPQMRTCIETISQQRPIFAQMIGEDADALCRTARELCALPVCGIDLNLGCPAPKVFRKNVGGGLLRNPEDVDMLLGRLRETVDDRILSVKMRYGFDDDRNFDRLLAIISRHGLDLVTVHARTVMQLYRGRPDYSYIAKAVRSLPCPVLANGDISSAEKAVQVLAQTGAHGVMIGRPAVRNPWIFRQCADRMRGEPVFRPLLAHVRHYVDSLLAVTGSPGLPEGYHISRMKKLLNFIGTGVDHEGGFLRQMRVAQSRRELLEVCDHYMLAQGRAQEPFSLDQHPHLIARPNHEGPLPGESA